MTSMITTQALQRRLDTRTKPQGSLGALEALAIQLGSVLQTETPAMRAPAVFVFAADHGIAADSVSAFPQAVTAQMLENYRNDGAAINVLARQHGLDLTVVDAGVIRNRRANVRGRRAGSRPGTRNFRLEPAMSGEQCTRAIEIGRTFATDAMARGSNALLLGEMGIGNTACAALLLHRRTGWPLEDCVGRGTGIDDAALERKRQLLDRIFGALPARAVAVRNAGRVRRLRARDAHRRDARSRAASLHRGGRRLRGERRGAARNRNGRARARALRLQPLLGGDRSPQAPRTSAGTAAARPAPAPRRRLGRRARVAADRIGGATHDGDGELRIRGRRRS